MLPIRYLGLVAVLAAAPASGQTPPTAKGPVVPGVCLLSRQAAFAQSKVGLAATARIKELEQQIEATLAPDANALQADARALEAQKTTLKAADYLMRQQAMAPRLQALQARRAQGTSQIEITFQKANERISEAARPVLAEAYRAHNCGLLIDRNSVLDGNMANDLTPIVVQGLDAKLTTITFDLEPPPAAPAN